MTAEFAAILAKIQTDFRSEKWTKKDKQTACRRILLPVQTPTWTPGTNYKDFVRSAADINGWDITALYQGASDWLRDPKLVAAGCAVPTSTGDPANAFDDQHENPNTCSNTVQIGSECWLNGTANYGAYGIMVRLCSDAFTEFTFALQMAKALIRAYKKLGPHPEDPVDPIAWVEATYYGGPTAVPTRKGNRQNCGCGGCGLKGNVVVWDYIWEPIKKRDDANYPGTPAIP